MGNDLVDCLVTGATGYLGKHVLANLERKHLSYVATSRGDCDLTDKRAVRTLLRRTKPSVIIHCAAMVPRSASAYEDRRAAEASVAMVTTLAQHAVCPIVCVSSMTVYAEVANFPVREDDAVFPKAGYARGKWLAEQALFQRNGIGDVALRLPGLFGLPRRSGLLYNAAKSFLTTTRFEPAPLPSIWAAMAVQDAAEYVVRATLSASSGCPPQPVNIGYEGEFSVPAAVAEIAAQCGLVWESPQERVRPFSMCLDRLKQRYSLLSVTFLQRLKEFIDVVRHDLQAERTDASHA